MSKKFCNRRPKRIFLQKIALKISGLDHALEELGGGCGLGGRGLRGTGGGGGRPVVVRHSNISLVHAQEPQILLVQSRAWVTLRTQCFCQKLFEVGSCTPLNFRGCFGIKTQCAPRCSNVR